MGRTSFATLWTNKLVQKFKVHVRDERTDMVRKIELRAYSTL